MDALSLGLLGVGLLAAIAAVFVAMTESETESGTVKPQAATQVSAPRRTRRPPQAVRSDVTTIAAPPAANYTPVTSTTMNGKDPLSTWLGEQVHVLTGELQKLREQEQHIERRLKLMNGIAILMRDTDASSLSGNGGNDGSATSNSTRSRRSNGTRAGHRS
jgi:hypothetical protein